MNRKVRNMQTVKKGNNLQGAAAIDPEALSLHDAAILALEARSEDGFLEEITLSLRLENGTFVRLRFSGCFSASLELSQWIRGGDSIRSWSFIMTPGQRECVSAYERRTRANLSEKLRAFSADTNSTASRIELLCSSITATV